MSVDLSSVVSAFTESTNAVSAMIASLVTLFGVLRFKRRARAEVAPVALVRGGAGVATSHYVSNGSAHGALAVPAPPSATIYAPQGTITRLPRWVTSTHTPLVIIALLLIALVDVTLLQRTSDVRPVPEHVAPVIADASATAYVYDTNGNITSDGHGTIVFTVSGTWDGLSRVTRVSVPTTSTERSDFTWVADLKNVYGTGWQFDEGDRQTSAGLIAARLRLRTDSISTYSIARVGRDGRSANEPVVYVYARGVGGEVQSVDAWVKIGESTISPSGTWSVVGTVSGDRTSTRTTRGAASDISLAAIVVSPQDAPDVGEPRATTTMTLADLDAMGRSEIVTVVPRRGLRREPGAGGVGRDHSYATPSTGVPGRR